jgi:uncharacterized protein YdeI (YjbR/CyaY-like superfamily)
MPTAGKPTFFATPAAFRAWLAKHHETADELWVGFYKKATGKPTITWAEAVDEALCYGWIDGIRKSVGEASYTNRFTPRKPRSNWSAVNVARVAELTRQGRMQPAGLAAFEKRPPDGTAGYSYEQWAEAELDAASARTFRANKKGWAFFQAQPAGYRKLMARWIMSAKRDETRQRRLAALIADSADGLRVDPLRGPSKRVER